MKLVRVPHIATHVSALIVSFAQLGTLVTSRIPASSDFIGLTTAMVACVAAADAGAQEQKPDQPPQENSGQAEATPAEPKPQSFMDIYGFAQLDLGYDLRVTNPDWFDVNRPSRLPSVPGEFGKNGNTFFSVRQTRFGVKGSQFTSLGELKYQFEFDMFGVGVNAGQTTIRPRHYYGEIGPVLAGQTNSVFMDVNVFPNILEYWGPNGMVFLRLPQLRLTAGGNGPTTFMVSLEQANASADSSSIADRVDLTNVHGRFQYPDVAAAVSHTWHNKSYLRLAGILRDFKIDNTATNYTQNLTGWGVNASANLVIHKDVLRLQYVIGDGIQNYMNDAPFDVAPEANVGNLVRPIKGKPVPMHSFVVYLDHTWNDHWTSAIGYSELVTENTSLQAPATFRKGRYASVNLLYSPFKNFLTGGEFQYGKRYNFTNGYNPDDYRVQFSFKYAWDFKVFGKKS
jgi:hypothetical protein